MKIALCDDDMMFLKKLKTYIEDNFGDCCELFDSAESLVDALKTSVYDCILLDIDMPQVNGFQASSLINKQTPKTPIVFLTQHTNLVFDSFQFRPFDFVVKENIEINLPKALDRLRKSQLNQGAGKLLIVQNGVQIAINTSEIYYIESVHNELHFYGKGTQPIAVTIGTMKEIIKSLTDDFMRVHSGFIVNMSWVTRMNSTEIILANNRIIPLSRSNSQRFKQRFQQYIFEKKVGAKWNR